MREIDLVRRGQHVEQLVKKKITRWWGKSFVEQPTIADSGSKQPYRADFLYPHKHILVEAKTSVAQPSKGKHELDSYMLNMVFSSRPPVGDWWGVLTDSQTWWYRHYISGQPVDKWHKPGRTRWWSNIGLPARPLTGKEREIYKYHTLDIASDGTVLKRCNRCHLWKAEGDYTQSSSGRYNLESRCRTCVHHRYHQSVQSQDTETPCSSTEKS